MPNKISVSGSLSHIMTSVRKPKTGNVQRCNVALPSDDIDDSSVVLRCIAAGSIVVL